MPKQYKIETSEAVDTYLPDDGTVVLYLAQENSKLQFKAKKADGTIVVLLEEV